MVDTGFFNNPNKVVIGNSVGFFFQTFISILFVYVRLFFYSTNIFFSFFFVKELNLRKIIFLFKT